MRTPRKSLPLFVLTSLLPFFLAGEEPSSGPTFMSSMSDAVAKAEKEKKPLILIFSASWCPPCQQMKRVVYPSAEVKPYHDQFIWAYLDADLPENHEFMQRYNVQGIPHLVINDASGNLKNQLRGAVSSTEFASVLEEVVNSPEKAE